MMDVNTVAKILTPNDYDRMQIESLLNMNYNYGSVANGQPSLPEPPTIILGRRKKVKRK